MTEDKIAAIERAIEAIRYARADPGCPEYAAYNLLREYASALRTETPVTVGRVLRAMEYQIQAAKKVKAGLGSYDIGHCQTITESLCGRWWPTVRAALERFEKESVA